MVVAEDLELGIEVEVKVNESAKGSCGMSRWHRLQRVVDLVLVTPADISLKHDLAKASAASQQQRRIWVADSQEMWSKATDEPFDEDLEDSSSDERVEETSNGIVDVPKGADADLHAQNNEDWDQGAEHCSRPDGYDLVAEGVCELRIHDLAVGKGDWEGTAWGWVGFIDAETYGAHGSHGQEVDPCHLEPKSHVRSLSSRGEEVNTPLSKAGSTIEVAGVYVVRFTGSLAALLVTHRVAIGAVGGIAIAGGVLSTS